MVSCENCQTLTDQCNELRKEIFLLHKRLDKLTQIITHESHVVACQTDMISQSNVSCQVESGHSDQACQTHTACKSSCTMTESDIAPNDSQIITEHQNDILFGIFMQADQAKKNQSSPKIVPCSFLQNQPFSEFDFDLLDKDINFECKMNNRSTCYFGDIPYTYSNITHHSNPIPQSGNYLCNVLNHVNTILPDFMYNSVLLTRYNNGAEFIGYHSDNEPEIVDGSDILTISLGETRVAEFRMLDQSQAPHTFFVRHGDAFIMSRASQDTFQHSITEDNSLNPRISITLRLLKRIPTSPNPDSALPPPIHVEFQSQPSPTQQSQSHPPIGNSAPPSLQDISTVYISDSMFHGMDSKKMSSPTQTAIVLTYPGATANGLIDRLSKDPAFLNIDSTKVKKVYLMCGSNNVDDILRIPRSLKATFVNDSFKITHPILAQAKIDLSKTAEFLNQWANTAIINVVNILPRVSLVRNTVINNLNHHIMEMSNQRSYIKMVSTEHNRHLFSFRNGFRNNYYFSNKGDDNVHLNHQGIIRIARHLKHFSHHN